MVRTTVGVVVGYVAMAAIIFATFSIAYTIMGSDGAFRPGSYDVTATWVVASLVLGFVAALGGGLVCAAISKWPRAHQVLAGIVLILGLLMAVSGLMSPEQGEPLVREGDVGSTEAMQNAKQPTWMTLVNPFLGAVGVLIGGGLKRRPDNG